MRPSHRLSVLCALVALALTAGSLMPAGAGAIEHGRIVRTGRGAPQRLDAVDGLLHSHEISEPDTTTTSEVVTGATAAAAPNVAHRGSAARADWTLPRVDLPIPLDAEVSSLEPSFALRSATPRSHAPARAPPAV